MTISDSSTSTSANKSEPCFFSLLLPQIMCCSSSATIFSVSLYLSFCLLWPGCLNCALTPFTVISLCTLSLFLSVNCISLAIGPSRYSLLAQLMISSWLPLAFTVPRHELPSSTYFRSLQIRATSTKQHPPPPLPPAYQSNHRSITTPSWQHSLDFIRSKTPLIIPDGLAICIVHRASRMIRSRLIPTTGAFLVHRPHLQAYLTLARESLELVSS